MDAIVQAFGEIAKSVQSAQPAIMPLVKAIMNISAATFEAAAHLLRIGIGRL